MVTHDLRHVAACWMVLGLGLDPAVVADKLGHADPDFTIKRYIGIRGNPTPPPWQSPTIGSGSPPLPHPPTRQHHEMTPVRYADTKPLRPLSPHRPAGHQARRDVQVGAIMATDGGSPG